MIVLLIFLQLSEINAFISSSSGDKWGIYKIKRAEELINKNLDYAKKDLIDVLGSNLSDSVKGRACDVLMFLPPDTLKNAETAMRYLLKLHFYKKRKNKLWLLYYFFKTKKKYDLCEKILRKISSDYPDEREKAQEEIFEIFLKRNKFEGMYPLLDFIKKKRPDLYLIYLLQKNDTISFLFNYDTLRNVKNLPYSDSVSKLYKNILGFNDTLINDPDAELLKKWQIYYFEKKNKKKADSLRNILTSDYGYILPLYPDSSYIPEILVTILEKRKIFWDEVYKRGLYDLIYRYAGKRNRYYLPSLYFLSLQKKKIEFPDTLKGDSLFISLILFRKNKKGLNFVPSKYKYLKGRFYFLKKKPDSAVYFLKFSDFYNDISLLIYLLSLKKDTSTIDSLLKNMDIIRILRFKKGRLGLINYLFLKRDKNVLYKTYRFLKKYDNILLKKYYKIFISYLEENSNFRELFKFSIYLQDDTLKIKSLLNIGISEYADYYFRRKKIKSKFISKRIFRFYAENGDIKGIKRLKGLLKKNFEKEKKWIDSVFSFYVKAIEYLKNEKYDRADSIFSMIENDELLKKKILFEKANISFVMGKLHVAKKLYSKIYKEYNDVIALYNLSVVLRKLSHDSTIYYYKLYLEKTRGTPDFYFAKKRLAYLYIDMGKYKTAKKLLENIYGLSPTVFEEKELKFFYMQILRALLDFESAMREGVIIYLNYPYDELFSKTAFDESSELAKILKFNLKKYITPHK